MWLYVPNLPSSTSSVSAPASEGSNSESASPLIVSERAVASSLQWRGKPQPPQAWSRRWKQGGFIRLLSGLTCEPSTADAGVDSFISSLREIPVRTTPSPESAPEPMASVSLPPRSAALPPSAGLILSSVRTCRGTRTDSLQPSSQHWKNWATALRQEYSRRPKPATPCGASDCSSWPSAKTVSGGWERDQNGNVYLTLEGAASEWIAPVADDTGTRTARYSQGGMAFSMQAANWPAPVARDHKGVNSVEHLGKSSGSLHLDQLPNFVEHCLPPSFPAQPTADGSTCSTASPNSNLPSAKRKLNPIFVEALMRWPTGLSGFERQETAWTQWWQLQRSYLSALDWGSSKAAQEEMF